MSVMWKTHMVRAHFALICPVSLSFCSTRLHGSRGAGSVLTCFWLLLGHSLATFQWHHTSLKTSFLEGLILFQAHPSCLQAASQQLASRLHIPPSQSAPQCYISILKFCLPSSVLQVLNCVGGRERRRGGQAPFPPQIY